MAFISLPTAVKVEMIFSLNGESMVLVWFVMPEGDPILITSVELANIAEAFRVAWNTWRTFLSNTARLNQIVATDVDAEDGIQYTFDMATNQGGTQAGVPTPNNVAICQSLYTGRIGRSYRGRKYWGGFLYSGVTVGGTISTTIANGLNSGLQALDLELGSYGWKVGIASYIKDGEPRTEGVITPVISWGVDPVSDSQRRRLPGRGA